MRKMKRMSIKLQFCCLSTHGRGLRELDPQASVLRKARKLPCRSYISPGPYAGWHVDEYNKPKPNGLPIQGCVDGFSRRILWLKVCKSNNYAVIPASFPLMQWKKTDCDQYWCKQTVALRMVHWLPYNAFYPMKRLHIVVHFHMPISACKADGHIVKGASLRES